MKPCIFVLDDDPAIVEVTQLILQEDGYEVVVGYSENDLYSALSKQRPALILMDIWLAQSDGGEITRKLKADPATKDIPVILFSALNEIQTLSKNAGADGFLRKPYEMDTLLSLVKSYVK